MAVVTAQLQSVPCLYTNIIDLFPHFSLQQVYVCNVHTYTCTCVFGSKKAMSFVQKVRWLREARDPLPYYYTSSILEFLNILHSHHYWFFAISVHCMWLRGCDQAYLFSVIDYIREKIVQVEYTSVTLTLQCVYMYIVIIRLQHNQKIFMVVHVQPHKAQSLCQHRDYASITRLPREIAFKHRILLLWLLRQEEQRGVHYDSRN